MKNEAKEREEKWQRRWKEEGSRARPKKERQQAAPNNNLSGKRRSGGLPRSFKFFYYFILNGTGTGTLYAGSAGSGWIARVKNGLVYPQCDWWYLMVRVCIVQLMYS